MSTETAPDPVAAHKETCAACRDVTPCTRLPEVRAAARRAPDRGPLNHAPAGGQITTEEAAR